MNGRSRHGIFRSGALALALLFGAGGLFGNPPEPIMLVVMDPLAKELACACVKGYGQRDYRKLAARLKSALKQEVSIEFSDDLAETLALASPGQEMIIAGEHSLVKQGAKKAGLKCHAVCELTDPEGATTMSGSFIARADDPAKELKEAAARKWFFGLADTEENHAVAQAALRAAGVEPAGPEKRSAYSDAALDVLDSTASPQPVAVIPGYALRLLEGCGSITPGSLKVIGKTQPVRFITLFVADNIPEAKEQKILKTLLGIKNDAKLLRAMESRDGFKPVTTKKSDQPQASARPDWPDWRGPGRDGRVPRLPPRLPEKVNFVWKKATMTGGLAGLSVSDGRLLLAERDFAEEHDVYRCLEADNGELLWRVEFPARGTLDYGQSPRATPVIHEGRAFLLGAFGELRCLNVTDGKVIWKRHLLRDFKAELPTWGMCSSPLVVDDLLIVNPGGTNASLVALDRVTGRTRWTAPGNLAAYSAFIGGEFGGRWQIIGYDQNSLGGWDAKTGARLWQFVPPTEGDFNVPTPIAVDGGIVVATENNGTRFYRFDGAGRIIPRPAAAFSDLSPDTATPVVTRGRVFGADQGLYCLDLRNGLKQIWRREDDTLGDYSSLIADDERVLVTTLGGELILLDGKADGCVIISRLKVFDDDVEVYSHPALVGTRLYVRGGSIVACVDLGAHGSDLSRLDHQVNP
jgi:outer membrane protein assembly factor BamB